MPYLTTSQEYLEQSALLLEAYPDSVSPSPMPASNPNSTIPTHSHTPSRYITPNQNAD